MFSIIINKYIYNFKVPLSICYWCHHFPIVTSCNHLNACVARGRLMHLPSLCSVNNLAWHDFQNLEGPRPIHRHAWQLWPFLLGISLMSWFFYSMGSLSLNVLVLIWAPCRIGRTGSYCTRIPNTQPCFRLAYSSLLVACFILPEPIFYHGHHSIGIGLPPFASGACWFPAG